MAKRRQAGKVYGVHAHYVRDEMRPFLVTALRGTPTRLQHPLAARSEHPKRHTEAPLHS